MAKVKRGCTPVVKQIGRKRIRVRPAGTGRSAVGRKIALAKYGHTGCPALPGQVAHRRQFSSIAKSCARSTKGRGKQKFKAMGSCVARKWKSA